MFFIKNVKKHILKGGDEVCTADYGTRQKDYPTHKGIDVISQSGNRDIIAISDGIVTTVQDGVEGFDGSVYTAGNFVKIKHANGYYTRYLHLVKNSICVKKGQKIKAGEKLGVMGETGYSFGIHLHFDVNDGTQYIDPLPYLKGEKIFSTRKTINEIACAVIRGEYGNGAEREQKLTAAGYDYVEVQNKVNEILKPKTQDITKIAYAVIRGEYGNGAEREQKLTAAGYDYIEVQNKVNELLGV